MDSKTSNDSIEMENKETIEQILRFHECDDSIMVKMIISMAGSHEGDNYMSVVKRLIVSGTHDKNQNQNGTILKISTNWSHVSQQNHQHLKTVIICGAVVYFKIEQKWKKNLNLRKLSSLPKVTLTIK